MKFMKIIGIVILLSVIIFYILPKLISEIWLIEPYENNIYDKNYQEPLRVELFYPILELREGRKI